MYDMHEWAGYINLQHRLLDSLYSLASLHSVFMKVTQVLIQLPISFWMAIKNMLLLLEP